MNTDLDIQKRISVPWFGVRRFAKRLAIDAQTWRSERDTAREQLERIAAMGRALVAEVKELRAQQEIAKSQLEALGALSIFEMELKRKEIQQQVILHAQQHELEKLEASAALAAMKRKLEEARLGIVETEEIALLQEVGIYHYRHPLTDITAYQKALERLQSRIKDMAKKDGGAVLAATNWTVNGSTTEGRAMVRDFSKLMLRAFNAEADVLVRGLKPYKLQSAVDRLDKVASTIERLGKTMQIRISPAYLHLRIQELELTSDFLQKEAEEKEAQRRERERLREERKIQQEIEREKAKLEKERQHYSNALTALEAKGDEAAAERIRQQLDEVHKNIESVNYRAVNIRAGYVYVISNIGSFGEKMVKIGMTRRLDPWDRIRELGDASVPFNFDVHALFFSKDAVGIESAMHERLAHVRVNIVNYRREFFRATPLEVKDILTEFSGELLEFHEFPDALEYRQCLNSHQMPAQQLRVIRTERR